MKVSKEPVLVIYQNEKAVAMVKRDEESKKNIIYACEEMGIENIESLLSKKNEESSQQDYNALCRN